MAFDETVLAGTTGWTIDVLMRDSSSGLPKTGIDAADVQFSYVRAGGTAPPEWYELSSSTWQELSSSYAPGLYRLTVPNEAIAPGADAVTLFISTSGAIPRCLRIGLINANLRDATRLGLSALPNAAAGSSGGLPTVDANNAVKLQAGSGANQILLNEGKVTVGTNSDKSGYGLSSAALTDVAAAVWDRLTSAITTAGSIGKYLLDKIVGTIADGTHHPQSGDSYERLGTPATGTIAADIASVKQDTAALEGRLTADRAQYLDNLNVSGTLAHTGNADTFKADVSNLATSSQVNNVQAEVQKLTDMTQTTGNPVYRRFKQEALETAPTGGGGLTPTQAAQLANADAMATEWDGMVVNGVFTAAALQNSPVGTGGFTTQDRERLNDIFTRVQSVTAGQITVTSPFGSGTTINLVAGDSYSLSWSRSGWPDLTNATITLILQSGSQRFTVSCSASETTVTANIPASLTRQLRGKTWEYSVRVTKDDGFERTPVSGLVVVKTVPL